MKKLTLSIVALAMAATACASTPAPKGTWIEGANKMPVFVPAKDE